MRTVHILGSRYDGGAERFYARLVCALHRRGEEVVAVTRPDAAVNPLLRACGLAPVTVPMVNQWDLYSLWRIRRLVRRLAPGLVQTYMGRATRLTRVAGVGKVKHVARLGGFYKVDGYYRHADAWIANSRELCDYLCGQGLPCSRVFHIGNFVDAPAPLPAGARPADREQAGLEEDAFVILSLGRLVAKKGFDVLLRAFARLPVRLGHRPLRLVLCGAGPEEARLHALAAALGVTARAAFAGWTPTPTAYYHLADLFVCPSRHEPLGNVILEAWAHGLPVVSTRTTGARALVTDGVNGLLCAPDRVEDLAAVMERALGLSAAARDRLAAAGREQVDTELSEAVIVERYRRLYRELAP